MRTQITLATIALLMTGCTKEKCPDDTASSDTGAPSCPEDFTAQPGDECDADTDTPCMNGNLFMNQSQVSVVFLIGLPQKHKQLKMDAEIQIITLVPILAVKLFYDQKSFAIYLK